MNPVTKMFQQGAARFKNYANRGLMHMAGAEPQRLLSGGRGVEYNMFGRDVSTAAGQVGLKFHKGDFSPSSMSGSDVFGLTMTMGSSIALIGMGFAESGLEGAMNAGVADLAVNAAMVRHGYKWTKGPGGGLIRSSSGVAAMGGMVGRNLMGGGVALAANAAVGGGIPGAITGFAGGHLGVKHAGKIALAYGGYQAAKMTGNAVMGVMKQGYQYRQRQKSINTSGSMAAFNTSGAHTMRQRAVQAIHKSHLNARSALGSEAQFLHMPSRNYNSRYR